MKRHAKQHLMNATREAVEPDLHALRENLAALADRVDDLLATQERVRAAVESHLPRSPGQPEFLAQYHLSDVLAWRAAETSAAFVEEHLLRAHALPDRRTNLRFAAEHAPAGAVLEFGVGSGESLRWLEEALPQRRVVGFDSFEGLPEDWRTGFAMGTFSEVDTGSFQRAELRVGWFEDTLPAFVAELPEPIALLHVDCDLYSSTRTVLEHCMPRLAPGGIVVFDEFFNYVGWQHHEAKAWAEYLADHPTEVEYLTYVPSWEQISVRVG